jgi:hypothetical protein
MTKDHKKTWKCQACKSKAPKGDNSNTPVRSGNMGTPSSSGSSPDNVTKRVPSRNFNFNDTLPFEIDERVFPLDQLRVIVREELNRILNERMVNWIAEAMSGQIGTVVAEAMSQVYERIAALGNSLEAKAMSDTRSADTNRESQKQTHKSAGNVRAHPKPAPPLTAAVATLTAERSDSWVEVAKGTRRTRNPPQGVLCGSAAPGASQLQASEKRRNIHLFYVKMGTTNEQVKNHLINLTGRSDCDVESLQARGPYASFKLVIPMACSDSILSSESWPEGVCVKPWRRPFRPEERRVSDS